MNDLTIFNSPEFGQVRMLLIDEVPWFVGKDVTNILKYQNGSRDINRHVDEEDRRKIMLFDGNQNKETIIINESGLYSLILSSKLSKAKEFKRWVTSEILPSIRKNGGYIAGQENMTDSELMAKAILVAQKTIDSLNNRCQLLNGQVTKQRKVIEELQPKASYCDLVLQSKTAVNITQIAQDYGITATKMNKILSELKIQRKVGNQWILYKDYLSNGYIDSETINISKKNGSAATVMHTKWTQKGRLFLYDVLKKNGIFPTMEMTEL